MALLDSISDFVRQIADLDIADFEIQNGGLTE